MSDKAKFEGSIKATADVIAPAAKIFAACLANFLKMFGLPPEK
jgi:hypothetical protein